MAEARAATGADIRPMTEAMARAFHDDPVMTWLFGTDDAARLRRLRRFFRHEAHRHRRRGGTVLTGPGNEGGSFWDRPGGWRSGWSDVLRSLPVLAPAVGPRIPRALRGLEAIERAHPREPHWYLAILGTDPDHQGRGVGQALMAPVLERCDREGVGAYLESSKHANIAYYQRFGFVVTGQIDLPQGPALWPMWRDPR